MSGFNDDKNIMELKRWLCANPIKAVEATRYGSGCYAIARFISVHGESRIELAHVTFTFLQLSICDRWLYVATDAVVQEVYEADQAQAAKFKEHCEKEKTL